MLRQVRNWSSKVVYNPTRTYREELYSSRRISIEPRGVAGGMGSGLRAETLARGMGMFKEVMERDQLRQETRSRQHFIKPCRQKLLDLFKKQEGKFNAMVKRNIELIKEIQLAQKK